MERIIHILSTIRAGATLDCDTSLDSFEFDSMDIMELVTQIENEFKISIFAEDIIPENFANVRTIATMVARNGVNHVTLGLSHE